jgi:hypothetical protein
MKLIRVALELLGAVAFFGLHFGAIWWVYVIGSPLGDAAGLYWSAIVLGYIGMILVTMFRRRAFGSVSPRALLDAWLAAFPVAVGVSLVLLIVKWPLRFPGWNAHGLGASGGEANALFLPWLHLAIWVLIAKWWVSSRIGGDVRSAA